MTRRFFLPSAVLLWLVAAPAFAASATCDLVQTLEPVSHGYVQKVLERAEAGREYARAAATDTAGAYAPEWAKSIGSAWAALMTSRLPVTLEETELTRMTACLHLDVLLIECAMDDVRDDLREQLNRGSANGIMRLQSLLSFLNDRLLQLHTGALDPAHRDASWGRRYAFDPPADAWCCAPDAGSDACVTMSDEECRANDGSPFTSLNACEAAGCSAPADAPAEDDVLCPFDADYAPPFRSGFGCDTETMQPRTAYPPIRAESEALDIILREVRAYQSGAVALFDVQRTLDELFGKETDLPAPPVDRTHRSAHGCFRPGRCDDGEARACVSDDDCSSGARCIEATGACFANAAIGCTNDAQCGAFGPCTDERPRIALRALRGPFSLKKDHIAILSDFLGVRKAGEISREFDDELKLPGEFGRDETAERESRIFGLRNPLSRLVQASGRSEVRAWSRTQARGEAAIFATAPDAQLEIAEALGPLRSAVSTLARLASQRDGVRGFVGRFSYFLARTCHDRPCALMLERVIRLATTDECFPYTNGEFLSDDPDDPRWRTCAEAAGIRQ